MWSGVLELQIEMTAAPSSADLCLGGVSQLTFDPQRFSPYMGAFGSSPLLSTGFLFLSFFFSFLPSFLFPVFVLFP